MVTILSRRQPKTGLPFFLFSLLLALAMPLPAHADSSACREAGSKVVGGFARKRAKQLFRCKQADDCDSARAAKKLSKLERRARVRLSDGCAGVSPGDLGFGASCPDPSGRCMQVLDSSDAIVECLLCMMEETLDPLMRRLQGQPATPAETCGGCSATPCAPGSYCEPPPGVCDETPEVGVCAEVPEICPDIVDPVCGCDGQTYDNDCLRRSHRVGLFHPGPCRSHCGGTAGTLCPAGTFCDGLPGHCGGVDEGTCVPVPELCPDIYEPVCGCDGVTYGNDCERRAAGVRLANFDVCRDQCGFDATGAPTCEVGFYCELPPGLCAEPGVAGLCIEMPTLCPMHFAPVCGCDGTTYDNDCQRMAAGVSKLHDGACDAVCGGIAGAVCPAGELCEMPPGMCAAADLQGHCVAQPDACPDIFDPVCGCDDLTYANRCELLMAGVGLAHHGACLSACDATLPSCGVDQICMVPPGHCDLSAEAVCVPLPPECPPVDWPVCGCDGVDYPSPCLAVQAGAGIDHQGHCDSGGGFGCLSDTDCGAGQACVPLPGTCGDPSAPAICVALPGLCPAIVDPVCGCDGVTYPSACEALATGVGIDHPGECFTP